MWLEVRFWRGIRAIIIWVVGMGFVEQAHCICVCHSVLVVQSSIAGTDSTAEYSGDESLEHASLEVCRICLVVALRREIVFSREERKHRCRHRTYATVPFQKSTLRTRAKLRIGRLVCNNLHVKLHTLTLKGRNDGDLEAIRTILLQSVVKIGGGNGARLTTCDVTVRTYRFDRRK